VGIVSEDYFDDQPVSLLSGLCLDDVRSLSEAARRRTVEEQDNWRAGTLRIES